MFKNIMSFIGATALILFACKLTLAYSGQATLSGAFGCVLVTAIGYALYGYVMMSTGDKED